MKYYFLTPEKMTVYLKIMNYESLDKKFKKLLF